MADAATPLSPDIQRALQEAIGNVNDAAHISVKKKKKRARETEPTEATDQHVDESTKKRKKKKHRIEPEEELADPSGSMVPVTIAPADTIVQVEAKKKKKKKDKRREAATPSADQIPVQPTREEVVTEPMQAQSHVEDDFGASSADFLSAVVAAASATSHMQDPPTDFQQAGPSFAPFADQFNPYPPPVYPYDPSLPAPFGPSSHPPMFGDLDLSLTSSEELLHTLQGLDISKIASVLKTLEGTSGASIGVPTGILPTFVPPPPPPGPPPVNQSAVKSDAILGVPPKQAKASGQSTRTLNPSRTRNPSSVPPEEGNMEHAHMLANVWMNATKLSEMAKEQGLVYKKGKFSAIEDAQLQAAIENYRVTKGLTNEDMVNLIFTRDKGREAFWVEITSALHLRPIISVYHHVRRIWHPLRGQGKWMPAEDAALKEAIQQFGQQWEKVSEFVGRSGQDCRDRYRNHIEEKGVRNTGAWTKEEEEELTRIVTELTVQQGKDVDNEIFWGVVSKRMGGRRGKQQCRIKWLDTLSGKFKNDGKKYLDRIDSLHVHDDTEIDWKKLPDEHWNSWSPHALQRRWVCMKRSIKGHEDMTHSEIMDILLTKKAQSPPPPSASRPHKKINSAETIVDSDDEATPGSSTGPGTATLEASAGS
ncbi:hypothetical protein EIP86_003920 [Pleurotus ostreatoroseus]|nr:hypothetical protein EIP86_003920 [Pleurotus ostreatoroseus]